MSERKEKLVVILDESVVASVFKDVVLFASIGGFLYFNHVYLSGSFWIDLIMMLVILLAFAGRNSSQVFRGNKVDAIEWLKDYKSD